MMPANRPWYSRERKPMSKKGKIIRVIITIIILAIVIAAVVITHREDVAREKQLKIEEAKQVQEVAKQAQDFIPWLENSMNEYNSIYSDMKNTWRPYNNSLGPELGDILKRIYALQNDVESKKYDIPDDYNLDNAYQDHLKAIAELYSATAIAIKQFTGIDEVSQDKLAEIENLFDSSFSDENSAKEWKDSYVRNENDN